MRMKAATMIWIYGKAKALQVCARRLKSVRYPYQTIADIISTMSDSEATNILDGVSK